MTATLISAAGLREALGAAAAVGSVNLADRADGVDSPVVIDASFELADPAAGEVAWRAGHVPGAVFLDLERDLSGPKNGADGRFRGRHPLPDRAVFAATLGRCGISPATPVVVLDRQAGMFAAHVWWMLRWMGHAEAMLLDGGMAAWVADGGAVTTDPTPSHPPASPYPERAALVETIEAAPLAAQLGRVRLIDARSGERFRGESEPLDAAAGHIPGAANRCFKDNLRPDGRFKSVEQLRAEWSAVLGSAAGDSVVHQCGSGVTACHNLLAMTHAGFGGGRLYPGSWSEWSSDPTHPVARGG